MKPAVIRFVEQVPHVKTWHIELVFAVTVMATSLFATSTIKGHFDPREILGVGAVLVLFMHGQVIDRLSEGRRCSGCLGGAGRRVLGEGAAVLPVEGSVVVRVFRVIWGLVRPWCSCSATATGVGSGGGGTPGRSRCAPWV